MSGAYENIFAAWVIIGIIGGGLVGCFLEELLGRNISIAARVFTGTVIMVIAPLLLPAYLAFGARDLYRTLRPKKVKLPEARVLL